MAKAAQEVIEVADVVWVAARAVTVVARSIPRARPEVDA